MEDGASVIKKRRNLENKREKKKGGSL